MRLPRDLSGEKLAKALNAFGYQVTRRTGSHMRLSTTEGGEHHVTVPRHAPLRIGTLASIWDDVATHFEISRDELLKRIKDN